MPKNNVAAAISFPKNQSLSSKLKASKKFITAIKSPKMPVSAKSVKFPILVIPKKLLK
jgi:hypothetical protein